MTEIILVMNGHMTKSYQMLMYGQMNDTKHTKTFNSRPFRNSLDLRLVSDLFFFFALRAHELVGKKIFFFFFCSEAEKTNKLFCIIFEGLVRKHFFLGLTFWTDRPGQKQSRFCSCMIKVYMVYHSICI